MIGEDHHNHTAFGVFSSMTSASSTSNANTNTRGPFVYFVPKEAICGAHHGGTMRHMPAINIYQPSAPGRFIGLTKPMPPYLRESSVGLEWVLPVEYRTRFPLSSFI